eukprot:CAMPEP_0180791198 /NCGR_PEP_ID=MMETSP1038_2-20121128/53677_1 /TAXON_ID=632150 /ORGANISM="Azadinium spinosum, Strain 3D9" /LENGTH=149 /DNA_ID=CAMNT_0022829313 /DNA_START=278 /DNA_END=723 /DNA_ORIENTATION=-
MLQQTRTPCTAPGTGDKDRCCLSMWGGAAPCGGATRTSGGETVRKLLPGGSGETARAALPGATRATATGAGATNSSRLGVDLVGGQGRATLVAAAGPGGAADLALCNGVEPAATLCTGVGLVAALSRCKFRGGTFMTTLGAAAAGAAAG